MPGAGFMTAVRGIGGDWPATPGLWSYSSLGDAEECPRRWMLSRADYGDLWAGRGYPPRPGLAALSGTVVHRCLELLLAAFDAAGCTSVDDPGTVEAIRGLGGYTELISSVLAEELDGLEGNPRAAGLESAIRRRLGKEVPLMRERVQTAISRARLGNGGEGAGADIGMAGGSHTEVELRVEELRLRGRADLITLDGKGCTITDYKTGAPSDRHAEQLRLYGLMWSRDQTLNPGRVPVGRLVVSYASHEESIDPPTDAEFEELADAITARIAATEKRLALRPPPANPDAEVCRFCDVRHLCDDYWESVCPPLDVDRVGLVDFQGEVERRNGPKSWLLDLEGEPGSALLRTGDEDPGFVVGDRIRLLGVMSGAIQTEAGSQVVLTMTEFSESFLLDHV
jgi:PD-(D/E)XK nuclease superfamily